MRARTTRKRESRQNRSSQSLTRESVPVGLLHKLSVCNRSPHIKRHFPYRPARQNALRHRKQFSASGLQLLLSKQCRTRKLENLCRLIGRIDLPRDVSDPHKRYSLPNPSVAAGPAAHPPKRRSPGLGSGRLKECSSWPRDSTSVRITQPGESIVPRPPHELATWHPHPAPPPWPHSQ